MQRRSVVETMDRSGVTSSEGVTSSAAGVESALSFLNTLDKFCRVQLRVRGNVEKYGNTRQMRIDTRRCVCVAARRGLPGLRSRCVATGMAA